MDLRVGFLLSVKLVAPLELLIKQQISIVAIAFMIFVLAWMWGFELIFKSRYWRFLLSLSWLNRLIYGPSISWQIIRRYLLLISRSHCALVAP